MSFWFMLQDQPFIHDIYTIGDPSVVKFYCKGKNKTVRAPLSGSFNLNVQSQWTGLFSGSGGGSQVFGIIDALTQAFGNQTLSQPWFGRKLWAGTTPFKFSLPLRFVSRFDAYKEVFLPVMGLLSFMYPRSMQPLEEDGSQNMAAMYIVPGPNLFYNAKEEASDGEAATVGTRGDRVEISMGSFFAFTGCYITSINLTVENSFNVAGYPHNVGAQVEFEAMDASFVDVDGSFMEGGLGNQAFKLNGTLETALSSGKDSVTSFLDEVRKALQPAN